MKKRGILNSAVSEMVAAMGHTDLLVITDAGHPIPQDKWVVDLAFSKNVPPFLTVLEGVLEELQVEKVILAEEMKEKSPELLKKLKALFSKDVEVEMVPHEEFKGIVRTAKAIIRTGEFTPYANIILQAGVVY